MATNRYAYVQRREQGEGDMRSDERKNDIVRVGQA